MKKILPRTEKSGRDTNKESDMVDKMNRRGLLRRSGALGMAFGFGSLDGSGSPDNPAFQKCPSLAGNPTSLAGTISTDDTAEDWNQP